MSTVYKLEQPHEAIAPPTNTYSKRCCLDRKPQKWEYAAKGALLLAYRELLYIFWV